MFRNKEYILTVLKEGSFSKAAQTLYISQPSLSASVKRIEDKIASPIFNRSNPVTLTEIGKEYVRYALEIEQKERDFEKYVSDHTGLVTGTVKIGGSSLFSSFMLPAMISEFCRTHPGISFEIIEDNTKNLIDKLNIGMLDIIVDNAEINDESITATYCTSEIMLLAVPKKFEVNLRLSEYSLSADDIKKKKHLESDFCTDIKAFGNVPFILLNPENDTGKRAQKIFKKHSIVPKVAFYLDQQVTAYNIACQGLGVTFVSDTLIENIVSSDEMNYYVISDKETKRKICFYNKNNRYLSVACQKFLEENKVLRI
ncbi:MAG: LysR family transcriptional regulator [Clostridia bacterium]|nr:LysR family transcriptional regulator [Clostridia bacterium]